jgi:NifU-like protein
MWDYTDKVHEHFLNPQNVGAIENADALGEVGSLACGDALKLYLKMDGDRIADAKFQTFGCASAIASSSVLTEMIKGKTVDEALTITNKDIADQLGGLPKEKMHCSVMGQEALEAAIRNWRGDAPLSEEEPGGRIVCKCFGVTEGQLIRTINENNLQTVEEVTNFTKAGGACGKCKDDIQAVLKAVHEGTIGQREIPSFSNVAAAGKPAQGGAAAAPLTNIQRMQRVMNVLDEIIRPRLQHDGGNIDLVDIDGKIVTVALRGMCSTCPSSKLTVEGFVQKTLREQVESDLVVKEA